MGSRKAKIAVLVSGGGTNLQAIIDAEKNSVIKSGTVSLVISNNRDAYALERAKKAGIDTLTIIKKECANAEEFEEKHNYLAQKLRIKGVTFNYHDNTTSAY